jgi:hypothetical protein
MDRGFPCLTERHPFIFISNSGSITIVIWDSLGSSIHTLENGIDAWKLVSLHFLWHVVTQKFSGETWFGVIFGVPVSVLEFAGVHLLYLLIYYLLFNQLSNAFKTRDNYPK